MERARKFLGEAAMHVNALESRVVHESGVVGLSVVGGRARCVQELRS